MKKLNTYIVLFLSLMAGLVIGSDTFTPYTFDNVPNNVVDLWKDVDASKEALETEIVKEWVEDGIVCRYVVFKVGTFKGVDSRIAAFYTFPKGLKKLPLLSMPTAEGSGQK